jgi:hypothetical protein
LLEEVGDKVRFASMVKGGNGEVEFIGELGKKSKLAVVGQIFNTYSNDLV